MFNFTTTNVINSAKDAATGKDLWKVSEDKKSVHILRIGNFKKENIEAVYRAEANDPVYEQVKINISEFVKDQIYRIELYIGLTQASQDSRYSNDMMFKGKPFSIEFVGTGNATTTLKKLESTINNYQLLVYGEKLLDFSIDSDNNKAVFTAKTEYQRFVKVEFSKYVEEPNKYPYSGKYVPIWNLDDSNREGDDFTAGKEGFGTFDYIMHNLRLPTFERTRAFGIDNEEFPVVGAKYNQYTIHYCVDRGPLGLNAVGHQVKSRTTHVFYVLESLDSSFKDLFGGNGLNLTFEKEKNGATEKAAGKLEIAKPEQ